MGGGAAGCEPGKMAWSSQSVNDNEPTNKSLKEATVHV